MKLIPIAFIAALVCGAACTMLAQVARANVLIPGTICEQALRDGTDHDGSCETDWRRANDWKELPDHLRPDDFDEYEETEN